MENEIIKKEDKNLLLATVAKGATESEFQMFLEFCKSTGLNPFKKEIWFIKTGAGVQMMTGINGSLPLLTDTHSLTEWRFPFKKRMESL